MKVVLFFTLYFLSVFCSFAQDTILLLDGQELIMSQYKFDDREEMLLYQDDKGKLVEIDRFYIYSITDKQGKERIYYVADSYDSTSSGEGNYYNIVEMKHFVTGEKFARLNYKAPLIFVMGYIAGAGSVFLEIFPNIFYCPLVPASFSAIIGLTEVSRNKVMKRYPQYAGNEPFIMGFREIAKRKRVLNSLKGGGLGLLTGIAYIIVSNL